MHPYKSLPEHCFWKKSIASKPLEYVDPAISFGMKITTKTKVATAGSCFAQHIARKLSQSGYNYLVTEKGHPILSSSVAKEQGYGLFSARYGNIYTTRQLLQLFDRAFGNITSTENYWVNKKGKFVDPLRPTAQPNGYNSADDLGLDREHHLKAVKKMFEELDVFVFTLGLTECWRNKTDGMVYPICPGVEAGEFDSNKHEFYNQSVSDVINDFKSFNKKLLAVNPGAKVILTVSPVPLMATAQDSESVLSATVYSKSVLRVAAEELKAQLQNVFYFPSYEIITGNFNRGQYYAKDLRNVLEVGVEHVMKLFFKHATVEGQLCSDLSSSKENDSDKQMNEKSTSLAASIVEVECDEELLDKE